MGLFGEDALLNIPIAKKQRPPLKGLPPLTCKKGTLYSFSTLPVPARGEEEVHIPLWLRQLSWLGPIQSWKRRWLRISLPGPPLLNLSSLTKLVQADPSNSALSAKERLDVLAGLTWPDLADHIGAPDIGLRVAQVLEHFGQESSRLIMGRNSLDGFASDHVWIHWHALTWFARRFRPRSYLEISTDLGTSTAMVGMNSPETALVTFELGREQDLGRPHFRPTHVAQELARGGCRQPLTAVWGDSRRNVPRYFSCGEIHSSRRGPSPIKEFDLIFVDGSLGLSGIYQDLKNVFRHCALGGMVVFRGLIRQELLLPGQYCPRLHGFWERLSVRFPGFRYWKAPGGGEVGLALRGY